MAEYRLSPAAQSDLDEIFDYSAAHWGLVQCFALSGTYSESPRGQVRGAWPQAWWTHVKATQQSRWPLGVSPCGKPEKGLRRCCASCQGRQHWLRAAPCRKPFSGFYKCLTARNTALRRCATPRCWPMPAPGWPMRRCSRRTAPSFAPATGAWRSAGTCFTFASRITALPSSASCTGAWTRRATCSLPA